MSGNIGAGPSIPTKENKLSHKPFLFFTRPTIIGDYEVLMEKPAFATFRVYGDEPVN